MKDRPGLARVPDGPALGEGAEKLLAAQTAFNSSAGSMDLAERRAAAKRLRPPWNEGGPGMAGTDDVVLSTSAGAIPARWYRPANSRPGAPTLIYFHGGGWVMLDIDTHDRLVRELAHASGAPVISIDYPLAPESVFPGTIGTCVESVRSLYELGKDVRDIVLGGDSAGANIAMAVALALREDPVAEGARMAGLLLNYGAYDCGLTHASYDLFGGPPYQLTREKMAAFWDLYCPDMDARRSGLASPINADLAGLPPTRIVVADLDVLRDENLEMARRLDEAGVPTSLDRHPDMPYGFLEAAAFIPAAMRAIRSAADWIKDIETRRNEA